MKNLTKAEKQEKIFYFLLLNSKERKQKWVTDA